MRKRINSKSKRCIFVGYCKDTKGYRLIDPEHPNKIVKVRNVEFLEDSFQGTKKEKQQSHQHIPFTDVLSKRNRRQS